MDCSDVEMFECDDDITKPSSRKDDYHSKSSYRDESTGSSRSSSGSNNSKKDERSWRRSSSENRRYRSKSNQKTHKELEYESERIPRAIDHSPNNKRKTEKIPYFIDAKREEERLRRKYGESSRSRRRSSSRTKRRSRTRSYSRERSRTVYRHRTRSRERRRDSSWDRSRRQSRSPTIRHDRHMLVPGGHPPYIPLMPFPCHPHFVPYPPRFPPGGMIRPPFPPIVYVLPQPLVRPMGRWMHRPVRPKRNPQHAYEKHR